MRIKAWYAFKIAVLIRTMAMNRVVHHRAGVESGNDRLRTYIWKEHKGCSEAHDGRGARVGSGSLLVRTGAHACCLTLGHFAFGAGEAHGIAGSSGETAVAVDSRRRTYM